MKMLRNKSKIAIALLLTLSFAVSLFVVLPAAGAVIAVPDRPLGAFISTNPDLIGLNQPLTVNLWLYPSPAGPNFEMGSALKGFGGVQGMHFTDVTVTFTRPDGSKDTFMPLTGSWKPLGLKAGETEEGGTMEFPYYPKQVGTWHLSFSYPGQTYTILNYSVYYNPASSQEISFEV